MKLSKLGVLIRYWIRSNYGFDIDDNVSHVSFIRIVDNDIVRHRSMVIYESPPRVSATFIDRSNRRTWNHRPIAESRKIFYASDPEFFSKIAEHLRL